jgi:hypothetical protein
MADAIKKTQTDHRSKHDRTLTHEKVLALTHGVQYTPVLLYTKIELQEANTYTWET